MERNAYFYHPVVQPFHCCFCSEGDETTAQVGQVRHGADRSHSGPLKAVVCRGTNARTSPRGLDPA